MIFLIDSDQLAVLTRVKTRLYDEMHRLGADERRDLANAMDAVLHNVAQYGAVPDDAIPTPSKPPYDRTVGDDTVCRCGHVYYRHFDSYDAMAPVGCKYCDCVDFQRAASDPRRI